jgi:hypothetical protein
VIGFERKKAKGLNRIAKKRKKRAKVNAFNVQIFWL